MRHLTRAPIVAAQSMSTSMIMLTVWSGRPMGAGVGVCGTGINIYLDFLNRTSVHSYLHEDDQS